jgi:hypothetical protein
VRALVRRQGRAGRASLNPAFKAITIYSRKKLR